MAHFMMRVSVLEFTINHRKKQHSSLNDSSYSQSLTFIVDEHCKGSGQKMSWNF